MSDEKIHMTLRGPDVTLDKAIESGVALKNLLGAVEESLGGSGVYEIVSVTFQCDGCGLRLPNRPGPDEGWTYRDGDDLCPACSAGVQP